MSDRPLSDHPFCQQEQEPDQIDMMSAAELGAELRKALDRIAELETLAADRLGDCLIKDERIAELVDVRARYREANENDNATMRRQAGRIAELEVENDNLRYANDFCGKRIVELEARNKVLDDVLMAAKISQQLGPDSSDMDWDNFWRAMEKAIAAADEEGDT